MESAFRIRLTKTFQISEEENEEFFENTEERVEECVRNKGDKLLVKNKIEIEDTPEITAPLIRDILASFREKAPGPSGITRNLLLNAHRNVHQACFPSA